MPGIAELALAGAPIAGGALLGIAAGNLRPPDVRGMIAKDMDLLDRLPEDQVERRAELQRVIDLRIDSLIAAVDKNREMRELAASYQGNWRDIVVFICAILFTIIWWNVEHSRANWLLMFIVLIVLSILAGVYAARGILRGVAGECVGHRAHGRACTAGVGIHDDARPGALAVRGVQADGAGTVGGRHGIGDPRHGIRSTPRRWP